MKHTVIVTAFKRFHRGTLRGFANIYIPEIGMSIRDLAVHESASAAARWVQLPAKPLIDGDGVAERDGGGRIQYALIFNFDDRAVREAFSKATVDALVRFEPDAFSETIA